jgi:hypothetical protein
MVDAPLRSMQIFRICRHRLITYNSAGLIRVSSRSDYSNASLCCRNGLTGERGYGASACPLIRRFGTGLTAAAGNKESGPT